MSNRILIVDDSEDSRELLAAIVGDAGFTDVELATSAEEALDLLGIGADGLFHGSDIDLVLLDIGLPELDGIAVCARIRAVRQLRSVPVIMVTGRPEDSLCTEAFGAGAVDYVRKPVRPVELVARMFAALRRKEDLERREQERSELEFHAGHDTLTGVSRRRLFLHELRKEWRRAQRQQKPLAFVMIDLDNFHAYNEAYGHLAGDECLRRVAAELHAGPWRASDAVARFGGEEFAVLLPESDLAGARKVAESLRARIERLGLPHRGNPAGVVTASIGVACVQPRAELAPESLIASADEALFAAKRAGRNRVVTGAEPAVPVAPLPAGGSGRERAAAPRNDLSEERGNE